MWPPREYCAANGSGCCAPPPNQTSRPVAWPTTTPHWASKTSPVPPTLAGWRNGHYQDRRHQYHHRRTVEQRGARPGRRGGVLTRALKAPTLRESVPRLAQRARAENWSHEEFLVACLQRQVAARESHGGEGRIGGAKLPACKSLDDVALDPAGVMETVLVQDLATLGF